MYQRGSRESAAARQGFTPMFCGVCGGRESVATWKGICKAKRGTPPSPAATPPLTGEAFEAAAAHKKAPLQGELDAPEGADGGVHCRLAAEISRKVRQGLAPCFAGYVATRRVRRPGRIFAGSGAAPLRRLRRHLPFQGRLLGWRSPERLPCKGSWMRRKAQTEGCIAGLRWKYPAGSGRALPRSARRFRKAPRRARSPALHCGRKRAATRKRQSASTSGNGGRVAAGRVRRPGRVFAGSGAAPLRRLRRHLPLQGRLPGRQHTERFPFQGRLSSSGLLKAASPVKGRRWRRLPYPSTVTSVRRTWPASQASRSRMQGAGRLPAVRSTLP